MRQVLTIAEQQQAPQWQLCRHGTISLQCILLTACPLDACQSTPLLRLGGLLLLLLLLGWCGTANHWSVLAPALRLS